MARTETTVWVGLKDCGCCAAVCIDRPETPAEHTEQTKREFLASGLSVLHVSWDAWVKDYSNRFRRNCEHSEVEAS